MNVELTPIADSWVLIVSCESRYFNYTCSQIEPVIRKDSEKYLVDKGDEQHLDPTPNRYTVKADKTVIAEILYYLTVDLENWPNCGRRSTW